MAVPSEEWFILFTFKKMPNWAIQWRMRTIIPLLIRSCKLTVEQFNTMLLYFPFFSDSVVIFVVSEASLTHDYVRKFTTTYFSSYKSLGKQAKIVVYFPKIRMQMPLTMKGTHSLLNLSRLALCNYDFDIKCTDQK